MSHYGLNLSYEPSTNQLTGTATITATATQDLSRFDLDLRGFSISRLDVNGRAATFTRDGQELIVTPRTGIRSGSELHGRRRLRGNADGRDRSRLLDRGLGPDRRRRVRRRRAAGLAGLVPGERQPAGQGDLRLQRQRPRRSDGDGERRARLPRDARRPDDLGLARGGSDGAVPVDRDARALRPDGLDRGRRSVVRGDRPAAPVRKRPAQAAGDRRLLQLDLRAVSVHRRRSDRRLREGRRLLARDADEAGLRPRAGRDDARARAVAHVVRRLGHAHRVARHLAPRGLRDLVRVDLERARGQPAPRTSSSSTTTTRRLRTPRSGRRRPGTRGRRSSCSTGRSTFAAR